MIKCAFTPTFRLAEDLETLDYNQAEVRTTRETHNFRMCGRYQLLASADAIASSHRNTSWHPGHSARYQRRQQLRPTNYAPVVVSKRSTASSSALSGEAEVVFMKWGMSPAWSSQRGHQPLINARRETLLRLPTFRKALKGTDGSKRCAVPMTGFFEWHKAPGPGKPTLTPYLVHKSQGTGTKKEDDTEVENVAYMAGLYEDGGNREGDMEYSFVIITTEACKEYEWLHDRQPIFLSSEKEVDSWLDNEVTAEEAVEGLRTEGGLSWTRMTKDLSEAAKGKEMVQKGLDSFFGKRDTGKTGKDTKRKDTTISPRKGKKRPTDSLAPTGGIRKGKVPAKGSRGKQRTLSSFF